MASTMLDLAKAAYLEQLKHIQVEALDNAPPELAKRAAMNARSCGLKYKPTRLAVTAAITGIPLAALGSYFELKTREAIALCRLLNFDPESPEMKEIAAHYAEIDAGVREEQKEKAGARRAERKARARAAEDRLDGAE